MMSSGTPDLIIIRSCQEPFKVEAPKLLKNKKKNVKMSSHPPRIVTG